MRQGKNSYKAKTQRAETKKTLGGEIFREFFYQYTYLYFRE